MVDLNVDYQVIDVFCVCLDVMNIIDEENWQLFFEGGYFGVILVMLNVFCYV